MAVVEWMMSGTNTVGWPNIPASGKSFNLPIVSIMEIEDGLIIRNRDYWDWDTFHSAVSDD
jgi:ketosteroid isomerase-like protein